VSDELHRFPENMREQCGFGAGAVYGPGIAGGCRQANVALRAYSMAEQKGRKRLQIVTALMTARIIWTTFQAPSVVSKN